MRVLVGCERFGTIRRAFAKAGCLAFSVDLAPAENSGERPDGSTHVVGDVFDTLAADRWDLFIVHPECRFLSSSGLHWNKGNPERERETENAVEFGVRCWTEGKKHAGRVVLEQPIGRLGPVMRERFGIRPQIIQPYQFGDDASKATCLFLHNLPPLVPTKYVPPRIINGKKRWANQTDSGQNKLGPSPGRAMERARTYPGIAEAMADQWGQLQ